VTLDELVTSLETAFKTTALRDRQPMQPGDVVQTCANVDKAGRSLDYHPSTPLADGLTEFHEWLEREMSSTTTH
jgi:UDP-glucuronate 4-epimerase